MVDVIGSEEESDSGVDFFHQQSVLSLFSRAFLAGYHLKHPSCTLENIVHFSAQMQAISAFENSPPCTFAYDKSLIFGGWFYNFTTPVPNDQEITNAVDVAVEVGASHIFIPTIQASLDTSVLTQKGFTESPAFINAIYEQNGHPDDMLRDRLGGHRLREIKRLHRKAAQDYPLTWYAGAEIASEVGLLQTCSDLHNLNISAHNLPVNFYNFEVISLLAKELSSHLMIGMRRRASDGAAVQVSIAYISADRKDLYYVVQGIDHGLVGKNQNLYIATIYDVYNQAYQLNSERVHLGRGNASAKRLLGANVFEPLSNFILPSSGKQREVAVWSDFAKQKIMEELARLSLAVPAKWLH